jgi:hypothetical protein
LHNGICLIEFNKTPHGEMFVVLVWARASTLVLAGKWIAASRQMRRNLSMSSNTGSISRIAIHERGTKLADLDQIVCDWCRPRGELRRAP